MHARYTPTHCIKCISIFYLSIVRPDLLPVDDLYYSTKSPMFPLRCQTYKAPGLGDSGVRGLAAQKYTPPGMEFVLDWRWVGVLFASSIVLSLSS